MDWRVEENESGLKLSAFLKGKLDPSVPARQIKRSVDAGACRLNGRPERFASRLVGRGDRIEFTLLKSETPSKEIDRFLFHDDHLIAYNKPAGVSSEDPALLAKVEARGKGAILLHRLDRDTTGVLLYARNKETAAAIMELFKSRSVKKSYLAIVDGIPRQASGLIDNFLGKLNVYQGQTLWGAVDKEEGGLRARTAWRIVKRSKGGEGSLIECNPETGRTHQLRVHLSGIGHPILGDHQYGRDVKCHYRPGRMLLHAAEISFEHPRTKQPLVIKAPLPQDFEEASIHFFGHKGGVE